MKSTQSLPVTRKIAAMGKPHVLMVPYPMQGHIIPLMELGQCLAKHGIRITFVTTESTHHSIIKALPDTTSDMLEELIRLVSIPDVPDPEKLRQMLPEKVEELILEINGSDDEDNITSIVYDIFFGRIGEVAKNMGIGTASFLSAPAAVLVLNLNIPKLLADGIIDSDGSPLKMQTLQFGPTLPIIDSSDLPWTTIKYLPAQKWFFNILIENNKRMNLPDWNICNSVYDLEAEAFALIPQLVPVGPLLAGNRLGNTAGHLWEQDYSCLKWLDQQKANSVIYVAFGSLTNFNLTQFQELATGLELTNKPFLWAIRREIVTGLEAEKAFPEGFLDRVSGRGLILGWVPQQKVLSHAAIACFVSHCGWNSTMESLSNGVPLLCWPNFADQFINRSYISDIWKVGVRFEENDSGIITSEEITNKVDQLLGEDGGFTERALQLKETILGGAREGGNSHKNLANFINWIKGEKSIQEVQSVVEI